MSNTMCMCICANCTDLINPDEFTNYKGFDIVTGHNKEKDLTFSTIISTIFSQNLSADNIDNVNINVDKDMDSWTVCKKCAKLLIQLYKTYLDFTQLCHQESRIYSKYLRQKKSKLEQVGVDPLALVVKTEIEESSNFEEDYDDFDGDYKLDQADVDVDVDVDSFDQDVDNFIIIPDNMKQDQDNGNSNRNPSLIKRGRGRPRKIQFPQDINRRGRGRPRKIISPTLTENPQQNDTPAEAEIHEKYMEFEKEPSLFKNSLIIKRGRGRPRKIKFPQDMNRRGRGRPRKPTSLENKPINLILMQNCNPQQNDKRAEADIDEKHMEFENKPSPSKKMGRPKKSQIQKRHKSPLKYSILQSGDKKLYKCIEPGCSKTAKLSHNITLHFKGVHEQRVKSFHCSVPACSKRFADSYALRIHSQRFHLGEKLISAFVCKETGCGKSFAYPAGLKTHQLDHKPKNDFPFSCSICGNKFKRSCDVTSHMVRHTEDRPFICDKCGSSFKSNKQLGKHIKSQHSDSLIKSCHICGKQLKNIFNLRLHIKNVHQGVKSDLCPICGKSYSSAGSLKIHMEKQHANTIDTCNNFTQNDVGDNDHVFYPETFQPL